MIRTGEAPKKRARLLYFLILGFVGIICRLGYLQFAKHDYYNQLAVNQSQRKVKLPAERGRILDRNGKNLAESFVSPSLWADPGILKIDDEFTNSLRQVADIIGEEFDPLLEQCKRKRRFIWIKRRLPRQEVEELTPIIERTSGLYFSEEWSRFYSTGSMLSPVIGLVGTEHNGLVGLEEKYENLLCGKPGSVLQTHDARGKVLNEEVIAEPKRGRDLQLTLDTTIQTFLYNELLRGYEEHQPLSASGIVLDPHTGEILAMATLPAHQPGEPILSGLIGLQPRMVLDTYEPGSTMKPLIYATMLELGLGRSDEIVNCGYGQKRFGARVLHDAHGYGDLSMEDIIVKSSNIGAATMGLRLGNTRLYKTLVQLGFGQLNHLPLTGEPRGGLRPLKNWDTYSTTSIPMGHEISVNMVQMARAYATIANGGVVIQPCLEKAIVDAKGNLVRQGGGLPTGKVFSSLTCQKVIHAMRGVVERGTAKRANSNLYKIAGKTGTTEKIVNGQYVKNKNIGSFIALAPIEAPRLIVMIVMDEPKGGVSFGGVVAGPIVRRVMEDALQYLGVSPDPTSKEGI